MFYFGVFWNTLVYMIICLLPLNWSLPVLTFCPIILSSLQVRSSVPKSSRPHHLKVYQFFTLTFLWTQLPITSIRNSFKLCHFYWCICIELCASRTNRSMKNEVTQCVEFSKWSGEEKISHFPKRCLSVKNIWKNYGRNMYIY